MTNTILVEIPPVAPTAGAVPTPAVGLPARAGGGLPFPKYGPSSAAYYGWLGPPTSSSRKPLDHPPHSSCASKLGPNTRRPPMASSLVAIVDDPSLVARPHEPHKKIVDR